MYLLAYVSANLRSAAQAPLNAAFPHFRAGDDEAIASIVKERERLAARQERYKRGQKKVRACRFVLMRVRHVCGMRVRPHFCGIRVCLYVCGIQYSILYYGLRISLCVIFARSAALRSSPS